MLLLPLPLLQTHFLLHQLKYFALLIPYLLIILQKVYPLHVSELRGVVDVQIGGVGIQSQVALSRHADVVLALPVPRHVDRADLFGFGGRLRGPRPGHDVVGRFAPVHQVHGNHRELKRRAPLKKEHLVVTGCSFAGKMALFAGAFDERIALTIAQESGGGGYTSWRVSETLGKVETLGRTDHHWFINDMWQFKDSVSKLPIDHHELMAMVAPRALLVTGNPNYEWLADPSGYVASRATQKIYRTLGIPDRFGFSIVGGHMHCRVPESQIPEIEAFVDKFLLGKENVNTEITTNPYNEMDYSKWINW